MLGLYFCLNILSILLKAFTAHFKILVELKHQQINRIFIERRWPGIIKQFIK